MSNRNYGFVYTQYSFSSIVYYLIMSSYAVSVIPGSDQGDSAANRASLAVFDDQMIRLTRGFAKPVGKRSRHHFAPVEEKQYHPPPFVDLPIGLSLQDVDQFFREQRLDDISEKIKRGELELGDPDIRPSSPPPAYDRMGNRTNARDTRVRSSMQKEYHRLISSLIKRLGESYMPPVDYKPPRILRRVEIPQERYPEINFTGMILGARGLTHKRLEEESGCLISIRGRGTRGQAAENQTDEELQMPLHVCISSEDEEKIIKATELIAPLVDPLHPDHEMEKMRGLEQLAVISGTTASYQQEQLKIVEAGGIEEYSYTHVSIKCTFCGDRGHVSSDCPTQSRGATIDEWRTDQEYSKLIGTNTSVMRSSHPLAMVSIPSSAPPPPKQLTIYNQPSSYGSHSNNMHVYHSAGSHVPSYQTGHPTGPALPHGSSHLTGPPHPTGPLHPTGPQPGFIPHVGFPPGFQPPPPI